MKGSPLGAGPGSHASSLGSHVRLGRATSPLGLSPSAISSAASTTDRIDAVAKRALGAATRLFGVRVQLSIAHHRVDPFWLAGEAASHDAATMIEKLVHDAVLREPHGALAHLVEEFFDLQTGRLRVDHEAKELATAFLKRLIIQKDRILIKRASEDGKDIIIAFPGDDQVMRRETEWEATLPRLISAFSEHERSPGYDAARLVNSVAQRLFEEGPGAITRFPRTSASVSFEANPLTPELTTPLNLDQPQGQDTGQAGLMDYDDVGPGSSSAGASAGAAIADALQVPDLQELFANLDRRFPDLAPSLEAVRQTLQILKSEGSPTSSTLSTTRRSQEQQLVQSFANWLDQQIQLKCTSPKELHRVLNASHLICSAVSGSTFKLLQQSVMKAFSGVVPQEIMGGVTLHGDWENLRGAIPEINRW